MKKRNLKARLAPIKRTFGNGRKTQMFWGTVLLLLGALFILGGSKMNPKVAADPPTSGTVTWVPGNDSVTLSNGEVVTYLSVDGTPVYCLAMGVPLTHSSTTAQQDAMNAIWAKLNDSQKAVINNIAYLANQAGAATNRTIYDAGRLAVWHQMSVYGVGKGDALPSMITGFGPDSAGVSVSSVQTAFDTLITQAQALTLKPSFDGQTVKVVVGVPTTLTDTNGVLPNFPYVQNNLSGLTESISGNNIILNANSNAKVGTTSGAIKFQNPASHQYPNGQPIFVYSTDGDTSGTTSQPVMTAHDPYNQRAALNVNVVLDGSLKIVKKQSAQEGHQGSGAIAGAKFDVTMTLSDGKTVDTGINGTFETVDANGTTTGSVQFTKGVAHDVTTGKDGTVTIKKFSPVGDVAQAKETFVPSPYTLGHTDATGTLVNDPMQGTITQDSTTGTTQLTFTDNKQVGGVKFKKAGLYNGADLLNDEYQFKGTIMGVKDQGGNVVAQATLDEKGEGNTTDNPLSSPLVIGQTYTAFELSAGPGFVNTFDPKTVTFTYQGPNQVIDWQTVSGTNTEITGQVTLKKQVADAETLGNHQDTQGADVTLFYNADVETAAGTILHKAGDKVNLKDGLKGQPIKITSGKEDGAAFPDESGDVTVRISAHNDWQVTGLPVGSYYAQETQAGLGESLNTTKYPFVISKSDDHTPVISVTQALSNRALRWNVMFTKVLEEKGSLTGLNGAVFQILPQDEATQQVFKAYGFLGKGDTATSGTTLNGNGFTSDGLTAFYNIPLGTVPDQAGVIARYQIKEIKTPEGTQTIVPINGEVKVNLNAAGAIQSYAFKLVWSDTQQVIHEETVNAANLKDEAVLTIHPDLGLIADEVITKPALTTTAVDASDNDKTLGVGLAKVHDQAKVVNITPSTEYTLTGKAVNSSDGSPVLDQAGKQMTAAVKFTSDPQGNASVELETSEFDTTKRQGQKVTMLETVTDKNGNEVVKEDNWKNNPSQTVTVAQVKGSTQVKEHLIKSGTTVKTVDTYHYQGLVPGQTYTVVIPEAAINHTSQTLPVQGQVTFKAQKSDGTIDVPLTLNTTTVAGKDLTFTNESLILGGTAKGPLLSKNNDRKEAKETVHVAEVPKAKTPIEKVVDHFLPKTGAGKAALGLSLLGLALLGLAAVLKRNWLVSTYRQILRKIRK